MEASPIRVIALCSLILGGFFLAKSISIKSPKYVLHELLHFKVNKSRFFRQHISQKLESVIGFIFIFLGFGLFLYLEVEALSAEEQATGNGGGAFTSLGGVIGVTVVVLLAVVYLLSRVTRYFSGKIFIELMRFMVVTHRYPLEKDEALVLDLGNIMKIPRDEEDTVESYCEKVREKMKVEAPPPGTSLLRTR
ncbi:MAG: hypothetical protein ACYSX0_14290 [Planctomycetota bacterium]|jgi:hypothetical protein